jgi:IstB-like ATP binding protein
VSVDHVYGIAVRNPRIVEVARHYGLTIATCVPADPESKGGSEATVKIAKADLVATDHNLRPAYRSFAELEAACQGFMADVNTRPHRATMEPPVIRLAAEHEHLHRLPRVPHTMCFGETRKVNWQSLISVGGAQYSVPHELVDQRVWARSDGEQLVVVHVDGHLGPREVARHRLTTPGRPSIQDEHHPPATVTSARSCTRLECRHRIDDSVNKAIGKLIRVDLLVIDDVGLLPISTDAAEALFRVVDAAYEKRSIAISSNVHPSGFDELMPKSLATATVERPLHHAHVLITDGQDSYRLAQATAGKGVRPLT